MCQHSPHRLEAPTSSDAGCGAEPAADRAAAPAALAPAVEEPA